MTWITTLLGFARIVPAQAWGYIVCAVVPMGLAGWLWMQNAGLRSDLQELAIESAATQTELLSAQFHQRRMGAERDQCIAELTRAQTATDALRVERERIETDFDRLQAEIQGMAEGDCLTPLERAIRGN